MARIDYLAEHLSDLTGSKFVILRGRVDRKMVYGLKVVKEDYAYQFQSTRFMTLNELTRWLASICDMVQMGFIPVKEQNNVR